MSTMEGCSTYFDESRTSPLHAMHKKRIPPECAGSLVIMVFFSWSNPDGRYRSDEREEDDDQMKETEGCRTGFEDVQVEINIDESPQPFQSMNIIRQSSHKLRS